MMKKQMVCALIVRLLISVLLIGLLALVPSRCMAQTVKPDAKPQAQTLPATYSFEGCYELKIGRWWPWGFGEENDLVTPPSRIELLKERGTTGFERDKLLIRTIPRQDPPSGSRESSFWTEKSQSELILEWTDGFVGVHLDLAKNKDDLTGWAHPHFDATKLVPRTARVTLRRITCPPQ